VAGKTPWVRNPLRAKVADRQHVTPAGPICDGLPRGTGYGCSPPRTRLKQLLAAALALAACGFGPLAAVGAALGWITRSRLRPLANHTQGLRWANVAIAVGLINSTLWVAAWTWITLEPPSPRALAGDADLGMPFATQPMVATPRFQDFPELETLPVIADDGSVEATWTRRLGQILLTDVGDGVNSLSVTLEEQASLAYAKGRTPVVWLVATECRRCDGVAGALKHPRLQRALSHSILIRVDASQFGAELIDLQVPVSDLPGFVLLSREGTPLDYLHAGEWDEDLPLEVAPVLESFVEREPSRRRFPWRGGARADETPI
jgi:hypothetical protein